MLTSFGCEQIVQVRATEFDSKSAGPGALQLRSIAGPAAERNREKGPVFAGTTPAVLAVAATSKSFLGLCRASTSRRWRS